MRDGLRRIQSLRNLHQPTAAVGLTLLAACGGSGGSSVDNSAPSEPPSAPPPPASRLFSDVTATSGLDVAYGFVRTLSNPEVETILPSGVAAGDVDNDGNVDLLIVRGDARPNLLYRNLGNLRFEDIAPAAGLAYTKSAGENYRHGSPALADLDGDGDLDLILPGLDGDPTRVYRNDGSGSFSDVSEGSGLDTMASRFSFSPALGDYDLDGDLDLMLGHWGSARDFKNPGDIEHLWRNDTDASGIRFSSVSVAAGLSPSFITSTDPLITQRAFDYAFAPSFARIDDDEYPDILIVADFNFSQVFINERDGTFRNATDYAVIIDGNGMGSAVGDYDGDGDLDWFVSSIRATGEDIPEHLSQRGNRLYRNDMGSFNDATFEAGVGDGGWGWGSCFADLDNDGHLDIYHTNGWPQFDQYGGFSSDTSRAFMSQGDGTFVDNASDLGLDDTREGRGIVCADFDNDGDIDLLQLHRDTDNSVTLYANASNTGNSYVTVKLRGLAPNTAGVGARITVTAGGRDQMREVVLGSNFASHNPTIQHFGLGSDDFIDVLTVHWPDGEETVMTGIDANQHLEVSHPGR